MGKWSEKILLKGRYTNGQVYEKVHISNVKLKPQYNIILFQLEYM
jgi:hypothetical protein